jgi:hypothetical protein
VENEEIVTYEADGDEPEAKGISLEERDKGIDRDSREKGEMEKSEYPIRHENPEISFSCRARWASRLFSPPNGRNGDGIPGNVSVAAPGHRFCIGNGIDDVHALYHFPENAVSESLFCVVSVVKTGIVRMIDEKLGRSAVGIGHARHGNGPSFVAQAICSFVSNGAFSRFLAHICQVPAALDHESLDHAVKYCSIIEFIVHVGKKILYRQRRFVHEELERNIPLRGFDGDFGIVFP